MNFTDDLERDQWSIGLVYGCYQVHVAHQPYPPLLAFWLRKALRRIAARKLPVSPKVIRFCEKWCKDAEASLVQPRGARHPCRCKCHRKQTRGRMQRWRSS